MTGRLSVALVALLALTGCGPSVTAGEITSRRYESPWVEPGSMCVSYDKNGFCTINMPTTTHHPERFLLQLKANIDGEWHQDWVQVSETEYETCRQGWHYPECEPR